MQFRGALLASAVLATPLLALPQIAAAQPVTGLYVSGGVGARLSQDPVVSAGPVFRGGGQLVEDPGFNGMISVGWGFGNGARLEIEGLAGRSEIQQLRAPNFPTRSDGALWNYGVMANALYDLDVGTPFFYPYIGVGAGYMWTNLNNVSFTGLGNRFGTNDTDGSFAVQGILGGSIPIPGAPGLSATVDYRFMDILGGPTFNGVQNVGATGAFRSVQLHNQYVHSVMLGVRYAFNTPTPPAPAPAPVAAPAPAPARSYLVFFDWDKSTLTDRARQIIKEAADNSTRVQYTRLDVNGYTDTSGTPQYNQGLSVRRAQAVAGELVRNGVPRNAISIQGFGDTHLLVPTGQGVREPQNRRVEIIIH